MTNFRMFSFVPYTSNSFKIWDHTYLPIRHWSLLNIKDAISRSWRPVSSRNCCTNVRASLPRPRLPWLGVHNTRLDAASSGCLYQRPASLSLFCLSACEALGTSAYSSVLLTWSFQGNPSADLSSLVKQPSIFFASVLWVSMPHFHIKNLTLPLSETVTSWSF